MKNRPERDGLDEKVYRSAVFLQADARTCRLLVLDLRETR